MSAAVMLCALLTLCACGGRHNAWREPGAMEMEEGKEPLSMAMEAEEGKEPLPIATEAEEGKEPLSMEMEAEEGKELLSMTAEAEEQKETKAGSDLPQEETDTADDAAPEVTPLTGTAYVRVDGCKIKNGPGKEYETAGTLVLLEELRVTGETKDKSGEEWYRIAAPKTLENGSLPEGDYYIEKSQVRQ